MSQRYRPTSERPFSRFIPPGRRTATIERDIETNPIFLTETGARVGVGLGQLAARQAADLRLPSRLVMTDRAYDASTNLDAIEEVANGMTTISQDLETGGVTVSVDIPVLPLYRPTFSRSNYENVQFSVTATPKAEGGYDFVTSHQSDTEPDTPGNRIALMRGIGVAVAEGSDVVDFHYPPRVSTPSNTGYPMPYGIYGGGASVFGSFGGAASGL